MGAERRDDGVRKKEVNVASGERKEKWERGGTERG